MKPLRPLPVASTIAQMRREFGVTARALRYYEQQGLLSPDRSRPARVYSHRDRVRLKLILKGQQAWLTLREIRELLDVYDREGKAAQMTKALPRLKAQVGILEAERRRLDEAIEALKTASSRLSHGSAADLVHEEPNQRQA